jgi:hypothetical protein
MDADLRAAMENLLHGHRQDIAALRADLEGEQRARRESETELVVLLETHHVFVSDLRSDMRESEAEVARLRRELHNRPVQLHPEVARITRVWEERFAECQGDGREARNERDRYFLALKAEQLAHAALQAEARKERDRHVQALAVLQAEVAENGQKRQRLGDVPEVRDVSAVFEDLNARELGGRSVAWLRETKRLADQFALRLAAAEDRLGDTPPYSFVCPISMAVFADPVIVVETGTTYQRDKIERWFATHDTDPLSNVRLTSKATIPNNALRGIIEEWAVRAVRQ